MTERVRPPAVAGTFYPADPAVLADTVRRLLADAGPADAPPGLRGLVVPHAGYVYSGPVAATAYRRIPRGVRRVVLLGPSHYVRVTGVVAPAAEAFLTPWGPVPVDTRARRALTEAGLATIGAGPHAREHSLEVQLPFLEKVLAPGWTCLPLAVGAGPAERVADCLDELDNSFVVVSTDLSHYEDHATSQDLDRRTADAVVQRQPERISDEDACGAAALRGLLTWATRHELGVELLDLRTSADTAGDPGRVVGYGAFAFSTRTPD